MTGLETACLARPDVAALLSRSDDGQAQEAADKAAALRARLDTAADADAEGTIDGAQLTRITEAPPGTGQVAAGSSSVQHRN